MKKLFVIFLSLLAHNLHASFDPGESFRSLACTISSTMSVDFFYEETKTEPARVKMVNAIFNKYHFSDVSGKRLILNIAHRNAKDFNKVQEYDFSYDGKSYSFRLPASEAGHFKGVLTVKDQDNKAYTRDTYCAVGGFTYRRD